MSSAIFTILLCFALLATLLVGAWVFDFHKSDAAGQGMTQGFTVVADIALLIAIAVLLLMAGTRGGFSGMWALCAAVLAVATAAAQFNALIVLTGLESGDRFEAALRLLVPAAAALLIAFAAMHYYSKPSAAATLTVALVTAAVAAVSVALALPARSASQARQEARSRAWQEAHDRDQALAKEVRELPAGTPVADLLRYTDVPPREDSDARRAAIEKIRQLPERQEQMEAALANQDVRAFRLLTDVDLKVEPPLCDTARAFARTYFARFHPTPAAPTFSSVEDQLNPLTEQLRWLLQGGCDCKPEIAALEQSLAEYPDPYPKKFFVDYLRELQGKPHE